MIARTNHLSARACPLSLWERATAIGMWVSASALLLTGCTSAPPPSSPPPTPTFVQQVESVRSGEIDSIHVTSERITDDDLAKLAALTGLRELLVEDADVTAAGLEHLTALESLEHLRLRGTPIDNDAMAVIAKCRNLTRLNTPNGTFTDDALAFFSGHKLELLRFGGPNVTDNGMATIANMKTLRFLHLIGVPITDEGLTYLEIMTDLESCYLDDAKVTDDGIERLLKSLPDLHFHINQRHHDRDPHKHEH